MYDAECYMFAHVVCLMFGCPLPQLDVVKVYTCICDVINQRNETTVTSNQTTNKTNKLNRVFFKQIEWSEFYVANAVPFMGGVGGFERCACGYALNVYALC